MDDHVNDQVLRFGGGVQSTTLTVGTTIFAVLAIILFFTLPRKYVVIPYLLVSLFIPYTQVLVLAGLHFQVYRMTLPFAWARVLSESKRPKFSLNGIDKALILWALTDAICATFLWGDWGAFVNRLGSLYNVFGVYFLLRFLVRDEDDAKLVMKVFAASFAMIAIFMVREQITGQNIFSIFGGVPEFTNVREGRIRSQAVFAHAIIAGTVGATMVPLWVGLLKQRGAKLIGAVGIAAGLTMAVSSSSATPLGACLAGFGALCMWPLRRFMRTFRWGFAISLICLHIIMKAPVWALIQRVNLVGGNSGYHRFELVNETIVHFSDWWLFGARNPSTWGYETWDLSNAFVSVAVDGGLLALIFYIAIFWQAFRYLGLARKAAEQAGDHTSAFQLWAFGCTLFATVVGYFGIWYFDQSILIWYALLAMIGAITSTALAKAPATEKEPANAAPPWMRGMRGRVPLGAPAGQPALRTGNGLGAAGLSSDKMRLPDWQRR